MSKHTAGTWRTGRKVLRTVYADDKLIGVMDRPEDATLAAAAPGLLKALKLYLMAGHKEARRRASVVAKTAIAKAEGEES